MLSVTMDHGIFASITMIHVNLFNSIVYYYRQIQYSLLNQFLGLRNVELKVNVGRLSTSTCMEQYGTRTYWCGRCSTSFRPVPGGAVRRPSWYRFNRYRNSTEEGLLPEAPREAYFCSSTPNTSMYY